MHFKYWSYTSLIVFSVVFMLSTNRNLMECTLQNTLTLLVHWSFWWSNVNVTVPSNPSTSYENMYKVNYIQSLSNTNQCADVEFLVIAVVQTVMSHDVYLQSHEDTCQLGNGSEPRTVLLWGDTANRHACNMLELLGVFQRIVKTLKSLFKWSKWAFKKARHFW